MLYCYKMKALNRWALAKTLKGIYDSVLLIAIVFCCLRALPVQNRFNVTFGSWQVVSPLSAEHPRATAGAAASVGSFIFLYYCFSRNPIYPNRKQKEMGLRQYNKNWGINKRWSMTENDNISGVKLEDRVDSVGLGFGLRRGSAVNETMKW